MKSHVDPQIRQRVSQTTAFLFTRLPNDDDRIYARNKREGGSNVSPRRSLQIRAYLKNTSMPIEGSGKISPEGAKSVIMMSAERAMLLLNGIS